MPKTKDDSIWASISEFCRELAPVVGPLVGAFCDTTAAIDRAQGGSAQGLRSVSAYELEAEEDDE